MLKLLILILLVTVAATGLGRYCAGPLLSGAAIARPKNISSKLIRSGIDAKVTGPTKQPFRGGVTEAALYIIP